MFLRAFIIFSFFFGLYFFLSKNKGFDKKDVEISKFENERVKNSEPKDIKIEAPLLDTKSTHQNQSTTEDPESKKIDSTLVVEDSAGDEPKINSRRKISDLNLDTLVKRHIIKNKNDYDLSQNVRPSLSMLRQYYNLKLLDFKKNDWIYIVNSDILKNLESDHPSDNFTFQSGNLLYNENSFVFDKQLMYCSMEMNGRRNLYNSQSFGLYIEKVELAQDVLKANGVRVIFQKAIDDDSKTNISAIACYLPANYGKREDLKEIEFIDFLAITNSYGVYHKK